MTVGEGWNWLVPVEVFQPERLAVEHTPPLERCLPHFTIVVGPTVDELALDFLDTLTIDLE